MVSDKVDRKGEFPTSPRGAAEYLLHPMLPETFLDSWFEKRPILIRRPDRGHLADWVDMDGFMALLTGTDADILKLRVAQDGGVIPDIGLRAAMDAYRKGATIIVNQMHLLHPPTARFCRLLEGYFYQNFQANGYLQPAGMKGFGAHFDSHDEFNLQIQGRKAWKVYGPHHDLPLPEQHRCAFKPDPDAVPLFECVTEPGDLVYIPRGFVHAAHAADGVPSLHVTVGMVCATWRDLLIMAVQDAAARDAGLRRLVPMGPYLAQAHDAKADLEGVLATVLDEARARALENAERRFALSRSAVQPAFALADAPLGMADRVARDPLVVCQVSRQADHLAVSYQHKALEFPLEAAPLLEAVLLRPDPVCARDLDGGLDAVNRLRLLQYLLEQGVVRREKGPASLRPPAPAEEIRRQIWSGRKATASVEA